MRYILKGMNLLLGANSFLLELTPTEKGDKYSRAASSESISIIFTLFIGGSLAVTDLLHLRL